MNSNEFCEQVIKQVRHATMVEKQSIRQELLNHIEDHVDALQEAGYSQDEASDCALSAMGNPEEIGRDLNKQYPLGWLVLSRAALILIILLSFSMLMMLPLLGHTFESMQARIDPTKSNFYSTRSEDSGSTTYPLNIKVPIGNDILYIYKATLQAGEDGKGSVTISTCNYDRNPFGIASQSLLNCLKAETAAGLDIRISSAGGGGNSGAYYWNLRSLPITTSETELYLTYDRYGVQMRVAVPILWEVLE